MEKQSLRVKIETYQLKVKVGIKGKEVSIKSDDFAKKSFPSIDEYKDFPYLKDDFFEYEKDLLSEGTANSYVNNLRQLINTLPCEDEARKWLILLPYFFSSDVNLGFQVLDYWMNMLNEHIKKLKDGNESSKAKTFANRKSALQAYINYLEDLRTNNAEYFSFKIAKLNITIIRGFKQQYTGITISVVDLKKKFLKSMRTEDRFPTKQGSVYYPARVLSKVLGKDFTDLAKDCINKITVYVKDNNLKCQKLYLEDIEYITIDKYGNTKANPKKSNGDDLCVYNDEECTDPLKAKSEADLSREHSPSIATNLEDITIQWKALDKVTVIINNIITNIKKTDANSISQKVIKALKQKQENEYNEIRKGLLEDFKTILKMTKFSLMQTTENSRKNKHS